MLSLFHRYSLTTSTRPGSLLVRSGADCRHLTYPPRKNMRTVNPIFGKPVSFVDLFSSKFRFFPRVHSRWTSGLALCFSLFFIGAGEGLAVAPAFVQGSSATPQTPQTTVSVPLSKSQAAGDLNVVVVGWNDTTQSISSVADSLGNSYSLAVGAVKGSGISQSI